MEPGSCTLRPTRWLTTSSELDAIIAQGVDISHQAASAPEPHDHRVPNKSFSVFKDAQEAHPTTAHPTVAPSILMYKTNQSLSSGKAKRAPKPKERKASEHDTPHSQGKAKVSRPETADNTPAPPSPTFLTSLAAHDTNLDAYEYIVQLQDTDAPLSSLRPGNIYHLPLPRDRRPIINGNLFPCFNDIYFTRQRFPMPRLFQNYHTPEL
jgi:hypothetical protein